MASPYNWEAPGASWADWLASWQGDVLSGVGTQFTAAPDAQGRFVTVVVANLPADSVVTITRDPSVAGITVRGTPKEVPAGGALVLTDVEFPYGVMFTYTAVLTDPDTGAEQETLTATVAAVPLGRDGMVVSDPLTNRQVALTIIDQRDEVSEFRGSRFDLAGSSTPLYALEEHGGWAWTNEWLTVAQTDRALLDDLLRHRSPVLLRVSAGCDLRDGWVVPEQIDVARQAVSSRVTGRRWSVRVAEVEPPASTLETVAVTLQDLADYEPTTLQALSQRQPTLLDLSLAVVANA